MTRTPEMMPDSVVLASTATKKGPPPPPLEPEEAEELPGRSKALDDRVEDIAKRYGSITPFLLPRIEDQLRRRLGIAPLSAAAAALAGLVGVGIRLGLVLLATALVGEWSGIPWGRWLALIAIYGFYDATQPWRTPPLDLPVRPSMRHYLDDWFGLPTTIVRESDLRDLSDFTRRWVRLQVTAPFGVGVAALMLGTCWLLTPAALSELPAGSIVLLAFLLYDFGALMVFGDLLWWGFTAREARYDHHLFWPSPGDSPEVRKAMQMGPLVANSVWITVCLALTMVFLSWDSPLIVPLAVGFIVIGYFVTIGAALGSRANVRKIIERSRQQRLAKLRDRIETFESRFVELSREESEQLRDLLFLHNSIRDAPASSTHGSTLARTATALILPTIMFIITVFGEVSAERFLDALIP